VKCKSAHIPLKQWALDELAKMEDRLREKGAVKDMESMFDNIKEEGIQMKLAGSNKDKWTAAKAICDKLVADWVYIAMHSFNVTPDSSFTAMIPAINKFAPPPPGYVPQLCF
jgi:hypothetical protein